MDTIFAVSSGAPPAAIAVLRVSGPQALDALRGLAGNLPAPRRAALRALRDPQDGRLLDRALVLTFPGPRSATGEDLVELHLHGGRAVVHAVEHSLSTMAGLRPAEPGEFTRRALLNGRMDLSEAEGLGDLLMAQTEDQRRVALRSAEGGLRREVEGWTTRLLALSAEVEALIDHDDEADVAAEASSFAGIRTEATALACDIRTVAGRPPVERLRDGLRVVLAGPPNSGKSTLLNALAGRDAAIVSPVAGTTRDRIEAPVVRGGIAYLLTDTAGLTATPGDAVEAIGIARAETAVAEADILLWFGDDAPPAHPATVWLHARSDQPDRTPPTGQHLSLSAATGDGIDALWARLAAISGALLPPPDLIALNNRQRALALDAAVSLEGASREADLPLVAEHLRAARIALDAITGRAGTEAMLDALFARFCIGK